MRKKHRSPDGVKLNLAAMLDMAFQLLAFFILSYKPAPVEGTLDMHLPPPSPITKTATEPAAGQNDGKPSLPGVEAIVISVEATPAGGIKSLSMMTGKVFDGPGTPGNMSQLDSKMKEMLKYKDPPYEQVVIKVAKDLRYDELMKVIDACTKQKLANGKMLTEVRFTELAEKGAPK